MPDEDEAQVEQQLKTPEQVTISLPPSAWEKPALAPVTQAMRKSMCETKPSLKAREVQAAKTSSTTPKTKKKSNNKDSNYQWLNNGVFRGIHPDHQVSPTAALLAEDEEDFVFHIDHDMLIASAIQDINSDPKSLTEAHSCPDWPLWKAAMDKEISTLEEANTWSTVTVGQKTVPMFDCFAKIEVEQIKKIS